MLVSLLLLITGSSFTVIFTESFFEQPLASVPVTKYFVDTNGDAIGSGIPVLLKEGAGNQE